MARPLQNLETSFTRAYLVVENHDGKEDDYLWQDEEKAEAETTPSDTELDPYDDYLTNVPQDVIDLLMISDDEQEDFEGF
ncbi:hypothetical protein NDU88_006215 [Pleurodeles waltl]|uniref:Uncharacterized protein n=1 Tax=Pleurodeles waltl TaxID=8319 RepID=A0AAV7NPM0_PLEWA|nr:hypothetical protein NDU88_006215 [Pleurodeles waltl]